MTAEPATTYRKSTQRHQGNQGRAGVHLAIVLSVILGRRRMLVVGLALFTLGSLLGGLSTAFWFPLLGRAIQGIGGAAASPLIMLVFLAVPVRFGLGVQLATRQLRRVSPRVILCAGTVVLALSLLYLSTIDADTTFVSGLLPGIIMLSFAMGIIMMPTRP